MNQNLEIEAKRVRFEKRQNPLIPKGNVSIIYNGCMRRSLDQDLYELFFKVNGWAVTNNVAQADIVLFDTCGVTNDRSLENMEQYRKISKILKPNAQTIICGCAVKSNAKIVGQYFQGDTFGPREKRVLNDLVDATTPIENFEYPFLVGDGKGRYLKDLHFFENFISDTVRVKVNEGCLNNCTFCGIKDAIGHLKSTPLKSVKEQLHDGLNKGYRKVCLISEDVAAWGIDLKSNVSELVQGVLDIDYDYDLGLFDMNPRWVIKYWDDLKHQLLDPRIQEVLLPIQSGSNRILELMKRHHEADPVSEIVKWLKTHAPNVKIGASVIVGFPSETDADFNQTLQLLENFDYASVSWFSPISGKKAAFMNEVIADEVMDQRAKACSKVTECRIFT